MKVHKGNYVTLASTPSLIGRVVECFPLGGYVKIAFFQYTATYFCVESLIDPYFPLVEVDEYHTW